MICVRTLLLLLSFSACRGWPLLDNERTPVVSFFSGHASQLIYEEGVYACPGFEVELTFAEIIFSEIFKKTLGNYFE